MSSRSGCLRRLAKATREPEAEPTQEERANESSCGSRQDINLRRREEHASERSTNEQADHSSERRERDSDELHRSRIVGRPFHFDPRPVLP